VNWEHFRRFPQHFYGDVPGGFDRVRDQLSQLASCDPVEFVARPGTILIWHGFLLHESSANISKTPRIGIFGRWGQPMPPGEPIMFGDMWEHWTI
jgi:hypothetical protein